MVSDLLIPLSRISFPGFKFKIDWNKTVPYLQIEFDGKCNFTGKQDTWKSRKWMLSVHMTESEVVQTAFKAVLTALEHEAREQFRYKDVTIFDPHFDLDKLVELRKTEDCLAVRHENIPV